MNIDKINVGGNLYDVCDTNARAMISDEYNSATQYSAGDYCIWENTLKKANKSTTGTYDHTAWDDTNIGEVVGELNQKLKWIFLDVYNLTTSETSVTVPGSANEILIFAGYPNVANDNQVYGGKSYIIPAGGQGNCIVAEKELYSADMPSAATATGLYCYWDNDNTLTMWIKTGTARARVYYR